MAENPPAPRRPTPSAGIFSTVVRELGRDDFRVPAIPAVAHRINQATRDPDLSVAEFARVIQSDPGLSAHLVRMVNSAAFRVLRKAKTAQDAVTRLGLKSSRYHAYVYTMRSIFRKPQPGTEELVKAQSRFSIQLAATASVLASACGNREPETAMLGALLQEIGVMPLIDWIGAHPEIVAGHDPRTLLRELSTAHARNISIVILDTWNFDKSLVELVRAREEWEREPRRRLDHADFINLARLHVLGGIEAGRDIPHITLLPAFRLLPNRELTEKRTLQMLADREQDILEIQATLSV